LNSAALDSNWPFPPEVQRSSTIPTAAIEGLGFHELRGANATAMVRHHVDLKTAHTRLGHSDPTLTLAVSAQATPQGDQDAPHNWAKRS
jgi:integrase